MKAKSFAPSFALALLSTLNFQLSTAHAQLVADGATNTLSNVTTNITGDVTVGTNGAFTLLVLSDNALLTNSANGVISLNATAKSNEVHLVSSTAPVASHKKARGTTKAVRKLNARFYSTDQRVI